MSYNYLVINRIHYFVCYQIITNLSKDNLNQLKYKDV